MNITVETKIDRNPLLLPDGRDGEVIGMSEDGMDGICEVIGMSEDGMDKVCVLETLS